MKKRNRLYTILALACIGGYGWFFYSIFKTHNTGPEAFGACMFKNATGVPCPSCGSTRAMLLLAEGDFVGSVLLNPVGLILAVVMLVTPFWLMYDVVTKKDTLLVNYKKAESTIKIRWVSIVLILLVLANWIWNIYKGL